MAAPVVQLAVKLTADTGDFRRKLDAAGKSLESMGQQLRTATNVAGKYAAALGIAGAAIGANLVTKQLKAVDALAKTSDKLGITTDALTGLRHAAELTGVASNTLDMALQRMTRRVAEAGNGTGEAKDAIKQLGLNARELAAMSPDQQFQKIAGAMQNVSTQGEKVRLAFKLFDSEGVSLVNTLALGEQGLRDMQAEADRLGISITRIQAAKVEAANDALTRAGASIEGVVRRATIDLAPVIEAVANEFTDAAAEAGNFGATAINAAEMVLAPFGLVGDAIQGLKVSIKGLEVFWRGMGFGAISSFNLIARGYTELANLIPGIEVNFEDTFLGQIERSTADALSNAQAELHEMAMQRLPSDQIEDFILRVQNAATVAAENMSMVSGGMTGEGGEMGSNKQLDALRDRFKTEGELLSEKVKKDHETLVQSLNQKLITEQEFWELERNLKAEHEAGLTEIEREASEARNAIAEQERRLRQGAMKQMFTDLTSLLNSESRSMFEIGKAAAISDAIVSTYSSAQKSYDALSGIPYVGPYLGAAAAAAAIAAGGARVNAIRSTSFGSKGAASAATGTTPPTSAPTSAQGGSAQDQRRVLVEGISPDSLFSGRQLIEILNEAQQDGPALITVSR